jgi:hypothetical protein
MQKEGAARNNLKKKKYIYIYRKGSREQNEGIARKILKIKRQLYAEKKERIL